MTKVLKNMEITPETNLVYVAESSLAVKSSQVFSSCSLPVFPFTSDCVVLAN